MSHTLVNPAAISYDCPECRRIIAAERAAETAATNPPALPFNTTPSLFDGAA